MRQKPLPMSRVRYNVAFLLCCVCLTPTSAQQDACQRRTISVSVTTKNGAPAPPLTTANFLGVYKKRPVHIASAVISKEPTRVILLIDDSDSMQDPRSGAQWNFAMNLGEDLIGGLPLKSEIGLAAFTATLVDIADRTTERLKLKNDLEELRIHPKALAPGLRKTALWDAVLGSFQMFDHPHLGDAIYVITDGGDNASKVARKDVTRILAEAGVRLFAFVFQKDTPGTPPEELSGLTDMQEVADATGGVIVSFRNTYRDVFLVPPDPAILDNSGKPTRLGSLLGWQYGQINSFYRVEVDLPTIPDKPQNWKLDLVGLSKPQQGNLELVYPHMLVPCR